MAVKQLPQWLLIASFMLGSMSTLCLYHSYVASADNGNKVLMAAVDPNTDESRLLPVSPYSFKSSGNSVNVPLKRDDRALMLEATLDHQQTAAFILDTGATYTSISRELAEKLGYNLENAPTVNITTANGQVSMPKIMIKSLTLNGYTAYNVEATVMPMPHNVPFSGLLGLSFVKRHRLTIDSEAEQLVIEPQRTAISSR